MVELYIAIGVVMGLVIALLVVVVSLYFKPSIERSIKQTTSRFAAKGSIMEPELEELSQWVEQLQNNKTT